VGNHDGLHEGASEGAVEGVSLGCADGCKVGEAVGEKVLKAKDVTSLSSRVTAPVYAKSGPELAFVINVIDVYAMSVPTISHPDPTVAEDPTLYHTLMGPSTVGLFTT
jgi:hypothetical protein